MSPQTLTDKMLSLLVPGSKWDTIVIARDGPSPIKERHTIRAIENPHFPDGAISWSDPRLYLPVPSEEEIITATPGLVHWKYNWGRELEIKCMPVDKQRKLF